MGLISVEYMDNYEQSLAVTWIKEFFLTALACSNQSQIHSNP